MWALAIPAVVGLVSAGAQWLNSRDAARATQAERDRIRGMLDAIQDPEFDVSMISPEDLQIVGKYVPQAIPLIQEATPQLMQGRSFGAEEGRDAQSAMLRNMIQIARTGRDPIQAAAEARAARQASAEAASARATGAMEAQRRGFGYSPLQASALGGQQDAMNRLALANQAAAADAYGRRSGAMSQAGSLGQQLYNQGVDLEKINVGAINDFNRRIAERSQDVMGQNIGNLNAANLRNLGEQQRVSDANVLQRNQAKKNFQDLRNTMAQQQYQNRLGKVGTYSGQAQQQQNAITELARQQNQAMQGLSDLVLKGTDYYYGSQQPRKEKDDKLVRGG